MALDATVYHKSSCTEKHTRKCLYSEDRFALATGAIDSFKVEFGLYYNEQRCNRLDTVTDYIEQII